MMMTLLFLGEDAGHFSKGSQGEEEEERERERESASERFWGEGGEANGQLAEGNKNNRTDNDDDNDDEDEAEEEEEEEEEEVSLRTQKLMSGTTPKPLDGEKGGEDEEDCPFSTLVCLFAPFLPVVFQHERR